MRHRLPLPKLVLVVVSLLLLAVVLPGQEINTEFKKPYAPGSYESLSGTITFSGERPKPRRIDTFADPVCSEALWTEDAVGSEGTLANVLVYLEGASLSEYEFTPPTSPITLEHRGCSYRPRVLGVRVGQPLVILNLDPTMHNTHPLTQKNPEWNQTQPPGTPPLVKTFKQPEKFVVFKCNQHPWEKAYVGVFDYPFFAVSDEQGHFKIEGLPPGQYRVVAWHERFGEKSVDITLLPGEARDLSFTFNAKEH